MESMPGVLKSLNSGSVYTFGLGGLECLHSRILYFPRMCIPCIFVSFEACILLCILYEYIITGTSEAGVHTCVLSVVYTVHTCTVVSVHTFFVCVNVCIVSKYCNHPVTLAYTLCS